jgi:hypothetical protein
VNDQSGALSHGINIMHVFTQPGPKADRQFREYMLIRTTAFDESRQSPTWLKFSSNHRLSNVRFGPGSGR